MFVKFQHGGVADPLSRELFDSIADVLVGDIEKAHIRESVLLGDVGHLLSEVEFEGVNPGVIILQIENKSAPFTAQTENIIINLTQNRALNFQIFRGWRKMIPADTPTYRIKL